MRLVPCQYVEGQESGMLVAAVMGGDGAQSQVLGADVVTEL